MQAKLLWPREYSLGLNKIVTALVQQIFRSAILHTGFFHLGSKVAALHSYQFILTCCFTGEGLRENFIPHFSQRKIQEAFPSSTSISFSGHLLWGTVKIIQRCSNQHRREKSVWYIVQWGKLITPQRRPDEATPVPFVRPAVSLCPACSLVRHPPRFLSTQSP